MPRIGNCQLKLLGKLKIIYFAVHTTSLPSWPSKVPFVHTSKGNLGTGDVLLSHWEEIICELMKLVEKFLLTKQLSFRFLYIQRLRISYFWVNTWIGCSPALFWRVILLPVQHCMLCSHRNHWVQLSGCQGSWRMCVCSCCLHKHTSHVSHSGALGPLRFCSFFIL